MKKIIILLSFFGFYIFCGCVSKLKYKDIVFKLEQGNLSQSRLRQENDKLSAEVKNLEYRNAYLQSVIEGYEERIKTLEKYIKSSKKIQNKMIMKISVARQKLKEKLNIKELELEALREQNYKLINRLESQSANQTPQKEISQK
ncbi:MAG: hypothetical protein LBD46_08345 [Endomicrobium sp.]|jgi:predicted  nucleic acid-binding Zn-ribbon protein|nr:hypothetical protein [Endomicrobium sp.]